MTTAEIIDCINKNQIYKIYKTPEWLAIKQEVMEADHYECQRCKEKNIITKAQTVHHIRHLKDYPQLAYSKYYTDIHGKQQRNLISLCNNCHNEVHDRFQNRKKEKEKPLTEEWW